jgi:hypothetical protein
MVPASRRRDCEEYSLLESDAAQSSANLPTFQEERAASIFITVENILKKEATRSFKESRISTRLHGVTSAMTVSFSPVINLICCN